MNPSAPVQVNVQLDSPQVVVYRLWFQRPADQGWTPFADGTDEHASGPSGHSFTVGPLPAGSKIGYQFILSGNPVTAYRVRLGVSQDGATLPGAQVTLQGNTDDSGVAVQQGEVPL
jgi:hypothetical protein